MTPNWRDVTSNQSLGAIRREDFNLAKEVKNGAKRTEPEQQRPPSKPGTPDSIRQEAIEQLLRLCLLLRRGEEVMVIHVALNRIRRVHRAGTTLSGRAWVRPTIWHAIKHKLDFMKLQLQ